MSSGIDYIKGTVGQPPCCLSMFEPAAPGKALASYSTSYGNFVYIAMTKETIQVSCILHFMLILGRLD